jgi:hypothetical protein
MTTADPGRDLDEEVREVLDPLLDGSGDLASTFPHGPEGPIDPGHRVPPADGADGPDPEDDP